VLNYTAAHCGMWVMPHLSVSGLYSVSGSKNSTWKWLQARRYFSAGVLHYHRMRVSPCYELLSSAERNKRERERERERNKQTARGSSTQCTNNSDVIVSTSELLLRQNSVTAHAHQSASPTCSSDHCATENHRLKSAIRPIGMYLSRYVPNSSLAFACR
jgi:hypothetical protein